MQSQEIRQNSNNTFTLSRNCCGGTSFTCKTSKAHTFHCPCIQQMHSSLAALESQSILHFPLWWSFSWALCISHAASNSSFTTLVPRFIANSYRTVFPSLFCIFAYANSWVRCFTFLDTMISDTSNDVKRSLRLTRLSLCSGAFDRSTVSPSAVRSPTDLAGCRWWGKSV